HPPHLKQLLPAERVTRTKHIVPEACASCHAELSPEAGPNDPPPKRFQTADVRPILLEVVEYQAHARTCPCCGKVTAATIPAEIRAHSIGPRLTTIFSYLTGAQGIS